MASQLGKNTITEAVRIRRETDDIMSALWILSPLLGGVAFFGILFGSLFLGTASSGRTGLFGGAIAGFVVGIVVAIILFVFVAGRGSNWHAWYLLPLVPVAAALAGRAADAGLSGLTRRGRPGLALVLGGVCVVAVAALAAVSLQPYYEPWANPLRAAGRELNRIAPANALVVFTEWDPTTVYYSERKGWRLERDGLPWQTPRDADEAIRSLEGLRTRGARYLVFTRYSRWWFDRYPGFQQHLESRYRRVRNTDEYTIFDLAQRPEESP